MARFLLMGHWMRTTRIWLWLWIGLSALGPSALAAQPAQRGTPERLERAAHLRAVRAGEIPSAVGQSSPAEAARFHQMLSPRVDTVGHYQPYGRVVFLSDGDPTQWASLAEPIAHVFPDKHVIKGDYDLVGTRRIGNLTAMHMDNTKRLPLGNGSADLVIMKRGLCLCHGSKVCGGLSPTLPSIRRFFTDVYRLLDPANPKAVAYLHGAYGPLALHRLYRQAADEIMARDPRISAELVTSPYGFSAIKLSHAAPN